MYFRFRPRFGRLVFGGLLGLLGVLLVGGRFSLCPFGGLCIFRVGLGCDGGGLFSVSFSSSVTTYHPAVNKLKQIVMENWRFIENQPMLKTIFKNPPIRSYKRGESLIKDMLVRAKL